MREIHYLIMWVFIATVAVHIYLSLAEVPWQFPLMFWGAESGGEPRAVREEKATT